MSGSIQLGTGGRLTLSLVHVDESLTSGSIDLSIHGQTFGACFETDSASPGHFVDQLERAYNELAGEATLTDYFGTFELKFECIDPRFGTIRVSGKFFKEAHPGAERGTAAGAWVEFKNLMTDQSHLPGFILELRTNNES